jgi:hypothetical protein
MLAVVRPRDYVTIAIVWLAACGTAFLVLFDHASTDDYAGWVIAMAATEVPPFIALATATHDQPLGTGRTVAIALPAALVVGLCSLVGSALLAAIVIGSRSDIAPLVVAMFGGLAGALGFGFGFGLSRNRPPHPRGARRMLLVQLVVALFAVALCVPFTLGQADGLWVVLATPIAWPLPLLAACRRRRADPVPPAHVVT